ncbi:MAG: hypothetical protein ABJB03_00920 [Rhodoglobus sp.]
MATTPAPPVVIEGRVGRKVNNALFIDFSDGGDKPFARAVQGGSKLGVLFGFKNGGNGKHKLTYTDGGEIEVATNGGEPTAVTRGDGSAVVSIERADASTATQPDGTVVYRIAGDPKEAETADLFRGIITQPDGTEVGRLDVIRTGGGWELGIEDILDIVTGNFSWSSDVGAALPIPFQGTRLVLTAPTTPLQRDVLLAACVDIALGIRPYWKEMR